MTDETKIVSALAALADELPPLRVDLDRVESRARRRRGQRQAVLLTTVATVVVGGLTATMITLTAGREPPAGQPPAPPVTVVEGWSVTPVPVLGNQTHLDAVAPVTVSDVWAVGSTSNLLHDPDHKTVIVHWDGQRWSPAGPANPGRLADIAAVSSTDVWAVGAAQDRTLAMHWDGRAWTVTPTPSPAALPGLSPSLTGLAPVARDDVWAVGCQLSASQAYQSTPLIQHWDGQRWTEVELPPIPDAPRGACLTDVAARGPNDIFAVGQVYGGNVAGGDLTLHWDGTRWSVVPRLTGGGAPYFPDKVIVMGDQVLAVGQNYTLTSMKAAVLRWDGSRWQPVLLDALQLNAVTSDGHGGIVVAGVAGGRSPALYHSTGGDFLPREKLPKELTGFTALATVPGTDIVWAVGGGRPDDGGSNLPTGMSPQLVPQGSDVSSGVVLPPTVTAQQTALPTVAPWVGFMSFGR